MYIVTGNVMMTFVTVLCYVRESIVGLLVQHCVDDAGWLNAMIPTASIEVQAGMNS